MRRKQLLSPQHKKDRFKFAVNVLDNEVNWSNVVFADEKRFSLTGPDGWNRYWRDSKKKETIKINKASLRGGISIWAAFYGTKKLKLKFLDSANNAPNYCSILESNLLPAINVKKHILLHDNARIHFAKATKLFLKAKKVKVQTIPAYSPDLNLMENVFSLLTRTVYEGGRQYSDIGSLMKAIKFAWNKITPEDLSKLVSSMGSRLGSIVVKNGGVTKY
uniref:DDE_3 domain-containing protein n=1 Tax=Rhabditophanes sp. KR3021 TaxID=114890 RepID=A0AC35U844_9BILA